MASRTIKFVLALALAATVGMVFFAPIADAVGSTTGEQTVTNETVTADYDAWVDLGGYAINSGSETVYGYNDSTSSYETATSGTDYEMNYSAGEIKAQSGSSLINDSETMKVSYTYQASNELTTLVVGFIPVMFATLLMARLALGVQRKLKMR